MRMVMVMVETSLKPANIPGQDIPVAREATSAHTNARSGHGARELDAKGVPPHPRLA